MTWCWWPAWSSAVAALVLAETAAAGLLLAVFMGSLLLVWFFEVSDRGGWLPGPAPGG